MREVKEKKKTLLERTAAGIDRAISAIAPAWGLRRQYARTMQTMLSSYRGASKDRLRSDWTPRGGSADADLLPDLPTLRERSRSLNRDDAYAASVTNTVVVNTVSTGIRPQSRIDQTSLGASDEEATDWQRKAERAFQKWCPYADSQNRMNFYEIQALIERQILENGEVIILPLMIDDPWRPYMLGLEVIEADRLETPTGMRTNKNIRDGVELGERGEPIAYWIRVNHPGESSLIGAAKKPATWRRYPARNEFGRPNILHLYWVKRPGQTRGEPFFAPVMAIFKDLADYLEAEVVAARIAACFAAFVTRNDPYGAMQSNTGKVSNGQRIQEIEPGMVNYLLPGEEITFGNPQRPGGTFQPFVELILRSIGAALNLPYELIAKDFSKTNYSSARAALLEARRFFKTRQEWLSRRFNQPIWEMFIEEAWLRNELPAVDLLGPQRADWMRAIWIAPGWGWVDPTKEVKASRDAMDGNLSTLAKEAAATGEDWEELLEQKAREQRKKKDLGIVDPPAATRNTPPAGEAPEAPAPSGAPEPEEEPAAAR